MKGSYDAKRQMLKELKQAMMKEDDMGLGEKLKGMKKVTVAAPTKKGLEVGLDKAQEILKKRSELLGLKDGEEGEGELCEAEEEGEAGEEDLADLKAKVAKLQEKLA